MRLLHETFPATLTTPRGTTVDRVKVFVTDTHLLVYRDSASGPGTGTGPGPALVYSQAITSFTLAPAPARLRDMYAGSTRVHTATLSTGGTVTWYRGSGCGCGSRLKTFNPFRTLDALPEAPFETETETED